MNGHAVVQSLEKGEAKQTQFCRFVPYTCSETKAQMVPMDLNIGFPGFGFDSGPNLQP